MHGYVAMLEAALVRAAAAADSHDEATPPNSIESPGSPDRKARQAPSGRSIDLSETARKLTEFAVSGGAHENQACENDDGGDDREAACPQSSTTESGEAPADSGGVAASSVPAWTELALEAASLAEEAQASIARAAKAFAAVAAAAGTADLPIAGAQAGLDSSAAALVQAADVAAAARADAASLASECAVATLLAKAGGQEHKDAAPADDRPHPGDMVTLGLRAPEEHRGATAVVTVVAEKHCTVVVLDETRRFGIGECWPCFDDLSIECRRLRLDSRVRIVGMTSAKMSRVNGLCGTICRHKREGHPTFIRKPSAPDTPQLTLCVRMDEPELAGEKLVLLEARFLEPLSSTT